MSEQGFNPDVVSIQLVTDTQSAFDFLNWIKEVPDQLIGVDVETDGLNWFDGVLRLVQFGTLTEGWAVPYQDFQSLVAEALKILTLRKRCIVGHNFKFDLHWLERNTGWLPSEWRYVHDTMALASVLNSSGSKALKDLSEWYVWAGAKIGQKTLHDEMHANGWTWGTVPINLPSYWIYGVLDTILTVHLFYVLLDKCTASGVMDAYTVEMGAYPVLYSMERKGMLLDAEHCHAEQDRCMSRASEIEEAVTEYGIDNINSTAQLVLAFQRAGVVLTAKTDTGKWKMDKDTFDLIAATTDHPLVNQIKEWRSVTRLSSTYYENFLKFQRSDGRCHPFYWPTRAKTGRMSATEPAILTVPRPDEDKSEEVKQVRNSFVAPDGHLLISTDFSNVEARIFAHYANETGMKQAFLDGTNLHKYTASQIFEMDIDSINKSDSIYTIAKNTLFCYPERTKALTQAGPKHVDDLVIGDFVLGHKNGGLEWTPIRAIHRPGEMEVITFENGHRTLSATGNHRWVAERRIDHGNTGRSWDSATLTTDEFLSGSGDHRLVLSAPLRSEDRSGLSAVEASLLGWAITDGHIRWKRDTPQTILYQKRTEGRESIKAQFAEWITNPDVCDPTGCYRYNIRAHIVRDIFRKSGLERDYSNLKHVVLSMGTNQVAAFWNAAMLAEGCGNTISQNLGHKYDAIRLACYLNGHFPGRARIVQEPHLCRSFTLGKPTMTNARVSVVSKCVEPVWCITTDLDSFVAVEGETYFLGKNCTLFGGGAAKIAITAGVSLEEGQRAQSGLYRAFPGIKEFQKRSTRVATDNLQTTGQAFIRGVDNRILAMVETDDRYYAFTNWQIQSTACVVLKKRLAVIDAMGLTPYMIAAIHDEVVAEIPEDFEEEYKQLITEAMTDETMFSLPIICATGDGEARWGDAK